MSDIPGPPDPPEPPGSPDDAWDAWRRWEIPPEAAAETSPWDEWKRWDWSPRSRVVGAASGSRNRISFVLVGVVVVAAFAIGLISAFVGEPEYLKADELIADIDAMPVTGPRDQRPPDTSAGETATFPAPGADTGSVASDIVSQVKVPDRSEVSGSSVYLLYEAGTVVVQPAPDGDGSEVVVFDDNNDATRRFPLLLAVPGWTSSLDTFGSRASSRGGIGGFRGGGGGAGK